MSVIERHPAALVALTAVLALGASTAAAAPGEGASRVKTVRKSVPVDGRTIALDTKASDVEVVAGSGDQARLDVRLEYWSNDDEWMDAVEAGFDVAVDERAGRVAFRPTDLSDLGAEGGWARRLFRRKQVSYSLDIRLAVPPGTGTEITNRYGDVEIAGVGGPASVDNSSGDVAVRDTVGRAEIKNTYGPISVSDCEGELEVAGGSGKVTVERVRGPVEVSNRYAETTVRDVDGSLVLDTASSALEVEAVTGVARIRGSYAKAEVDGVGGVLEIEVTSGGVRASRLGDRSDINASYGKVEVDGVDGPLTVRLTSGAVHIRDVAGPIRVENSYGEVRVADAPAGVEVRNISGGVTLERIGEHAVVETSYDAVRVHTLDGDLRVTAKNSAVQGEGIAGNAEVRTSYGGVTLRRVGGAVTVRNQSGRVEVRDLLGAALAAQHRVETTYGDILFAWPSQAAAPAFTLECSYCTMKNDFGVAVRESGSRRYAEAAGEGANVRLTAQSGSVSLRRD